MPKTITSPVDLWPGTITIADPLTFPQVQVIEDAVGDIEELKKLKGSKGDQRILPAVLACVVEWNLENFTPFPGSPRIKSSQLLRFIFNEIMAVYVGEQEIPNASSPLPIVTQTEESAVQN